MTDEEDKLERVYCPRCRGDSIEVLSLEQATKESSAFFRLRCRECQVRFTVDTGHTCAEASTA